MNQEKGGGPTEIDRTNDDDDDDYCADRFESVRTSTGLEIGLRVTWPCTTTNVVRLNLSTCLPETALAPLFDGTQWAGTRVWPASVVALQYLLSLDDPPQQSMSSSLLELGCGLGVPGMIWHAATPGSTVILTDKDDLVPQLRANLDTNFSTTTTTNGAGRIEAHPLDWSVAGIHELLRNCNAGSGCSSDEDGTDANERCRQPLSSFDIVLNCDCIFEPLYGDSWNQLLACQQELLRLHPHTIMLTCVERRPADGIDHYLQAARRQSSSIDRVERVPLPYGPPQVELYRLYGKTTTTTTVGREES